MHFTTSLSTLLFAATLLVSQANAYISGVAVNSYAPTGSNRTVTFQTSNYIQSYKDYNMLIGVCHNPCPIINDPISIGGYLLQSVDLQSIGKSSTGGGSFDLPVYQTPAYFEQGQSYTLRVHLTSIIGASNEVNTRFVQTTFTT